MWQERVSDVLSRLQHGAAYPELDLTPAIVGDDEVNAGAAPGGMETGALKRVAADVRSD